MHPSRRISGHHPQHASLRRKPSGQSAESGHSPQGLGSFFEFKMPQILLDDRGHRHAQSRGEVLHRHGLLLFCICQQINQTPGQVFRISRLIKFYRYFFTLCHLAEIREIRASDRHSVCASQMRNTTATRRRGIGHHGDRGTLEEIRQSIFMHVASKLNCRIPRAFLLHGFHISRGLRMVAPADD